MQAQQPGRPAGALTGDTIRRNLPPIGKVIGVLRDSVSREPMEFASVALISLRDSSATGGSLTDEKGHFSIEEVIPGRYLLRIASIGYKTFDTPVFTISMQENLKDFGLIYIPRSLRTLSEVNVTEERQEYVNSLDRKVFNVEKNLIATGGSVSDVLQNVPSVSVDIDGNVSLRGSENVTILIDGKPSGLTAENRAQILKQIPAGSIEQVEVITNPGARYDAEGMTGIINIRTKKDKRSGFNGTATAGIGTNDKYNASLNLNRRTRNFNFFGNYGYRRDDRTFEGSGFRTNFYDTTFQRSGSTGLFRNISHNVKAGSDWMINDYNTLGVSGGFNIREELDRDYDFTEILDANRIRTGGFERIQRSPEDGMTWDGAVDYRKTFPGTKRELSGNVNLTQNTRNSTETFYTYPYDATFVSDQRQIGDRENKSYGGQLDYVHPTEKIRYEGGIKLTVRDNETEQHLERFDPDRQQWIADAFFSDVFNYRDEVYAGYLQTGGKLGKFETQIGLRAEHTRMKGSSPDTLFRRDYTDLFPSVTFRYNLKKDHDIQLGYSRRISRPDNRQLNPFVNYSDSLNLFRGNPGINPEYIHSVELGYQARIKEQNVAVTLYHHYIEDYVQRFRTIDPNTGISLMTFLNFSSARNTGVEVVLRNQFTKGITLNTTFNGFYNEVNASNIESGLQSDVITWDVRATLNAKVLKSTSVQVTANYMAPRENPQGTFKGFRGVDVGIRQDFKGGKWSLNLAVSDIFDTRQFEFDNNTSLFQMEAVRKRETRIATLTLSYNFGSADGNPFQRRRQNRNGDQQQQQPDMMDF